MTKPPKVTTAAQQKAPLETRGPGRPPRIDRESILAATIDMGLSNLTLISIAKRLGVSTQALYRYFPDRDALIDVVIEQLMEHYPLPDYKGEDWCTWAYRWAGALYKFYNALPGMAERVMASTPKIPAVLLRFETSIKIARETGFDEINALWATRAITEFVHTWVAREQKRAANVSASGMTYNEVLQEIVKANKNIGLSSFSAALKSRKAKDEDSRFDYTLRCLLEGLSQQRQGNAEGSLINTLGQKAFS